MTTTPDLSGTLRTLLREQGPEILDSRARLHALLRERAPHDPRGVHLLMTAFDGGVPARFGAGHGEVSDLEIGGETTQLVDHFGSSPEHARTAVETWAAALGRRSPGPAPAVPRAPAPPLPSPPPASARTGAMPPMPTLSDEAVESELAVAPLASAAAPAGTVQPLPQPGAAATIRPLPLPGAGSARPEIRPLPGAVRPLPAATATGVPWHIVAPVAVVIVAGGLYAAGLFDRSGDGPAPRTPGQQSGPSPSGLPDPTSRTDEGVAIATPGERRTFGIKRLNDDPNSAVLTFGLRFGKDTYTYQAAVLFKGTDEVGLGLIQAVKGGTTAETDQLRVTRKVLDNGYVGWTMAGPFKASAIGAPPICVSALLGKTPAKLDIANGGGTFCAFGINGTGLCDGDLRHGCGDLAP